MTSCWSRARYPLALIVALPLAACGGRSGPLTLDGGPPPEDGAVAQDLTPAADHAPVADLVHLDGPSRDTATVDAADAAARDVGAVDLPWWPDAGVEGCFRNKDCPHKEYCHFIAGCGANGPGSCTPRPTGCPEVYAPVCGCDGMTYDNDCFAHAEGVSVLHFGPCGQQPCVSDEDCAYGALWCEGGACVPCDNSGLACDLACPDGWTMLERNGCVPCTCAPPTECTSSNQCGPGKECYAGLMCWEGCKEGDPACCRGNFCDTAGCGPVSEAMGCFRVGCPQGQTCEAIGCAASDWVCEAPWGWAFTNDCGGGTCVPQ